MYTSESSNALTLSENKDSWRYKNDREKSKLSSMYIKSGHVLEIGCGTGQILSQIKSKGFKVGVDYSNDRLKSSPFKNKIVFVQADVKSLPFTDNYFSNIVMSHFFHELIQFEEKKNLKKTIKQILSKLKHKGRIIIIDHCDPGKGYIKFEMNKKSLETYEIFKKKFKFYQKDPLEYKNVYRLNNLQNFITKIWSMGTDAENLEMNEDHTLLDPNKIFLSLKKFGLKLVKIRKFGELNELSKFYKLSKSKKKLFKRQFCLIMEKN